MVVVGSWDDDEIKRIMMPNDENPGAKRTATVIATSPSEFVILDKESYGQILRRRKKILFKVNACKHALEKKAVERTRQDIAHLLSLVGTTSPSSCCVVPHWSVPIIHI